MVVLVEGEEEEGGEARLWADLQETTVEAEGLLNQEAEEDE